MSKVFDKDDVRAWVNGLSEKERDDARAQVAALSASLGKVRAILGRFTGAPDASAEALAVYAFERHRTGRESWAKARADRDAALAALALAEPEANNAGHASSSTLDRLAKLERQVRALNEAFDRGITLTYPPSPGFGGPES